MRRDQSRRRLGKHADRRGFRLLNKGMVLAWRLGWGPWVNAWPAGTGRIMVLAHTGRVSGLRRLTPLNYAVPAAGDAVYCVAGFGAGSDWYRNLAANPVVEVWLPDGWWSGIAEEVPPDAGDRVFLLRQVLIASGFAAFLAGIDPYRTSDEDLARLAAGYRLIRIRRTAARTGPGGPGDLWWVWPVLALALLPRACRRRRQPRLFAPRGRGR
ncbi:nitroreductase/quinone reductase family protein [Amycolatopsis nivea]